MRSSKLAFGVGGLGIVIAAVAITWGVHHVRLQEAVPSGKEPARSISSGGSTTKPDTESSGHKFVLPADGGYQIAQASEVQPKILEAHIDPPDVHVGATQTLSIVVQDPSDIVSAEALIQTDHGTTTLPLILKGPVAQGDLLPVRYGIDASHKLAILNAARNSYLTRRGYGLSAEAAEAPKVKFEAAWKVKDTHDTKYHTEFVVTDRAGRTNSVTLAWSDACGIPMGGDWSLSSNGNCTISGTDGVDNGNATIDTYTLTLNSTFAYNPGQSISVTTGAIAIGSGGALQKTYLWVHDVDGDGYPGPTELARDTNPGGWQRRYAGNPIDCNDGNANVYQAPGDVSPAGTCVGPSRLDHTVDTGCPGGGTCHYSCYYYMNSSGGYCTPSTNNNAACGGVC